MSTGRVLWLIWCLLWAGAWLADAIREIPRTVCDSYGLGVCYHSGNAGSAGLAVVLSVLAVAAFWLPVGRNRTGLK